MGRNWIVVGDLTSSSGYVVTGSPFTDIDGSAVARVGDQATCPLHQGVFPIINGDPDTIIDGRHVALHGDYLACGCRVLSTRQERVFMDQGTAGSPLAVQGAPAAAAALNKPAVCLACLLAGAANGAPLLVRA